MPASERTPLVIGAKEPGALVESTSKSPTSPFEKKEFSFKGIPRRKKFILISMSFVNFCAAAAFSLPAPFFPHEASLKGASSTVVGFIFGMFEFIIFLTAPIFGNFISKIGCKFMYLSGLMVCGSCAILFGTLNYSPDGTIFVVMCFLCRGLEALGCSAYVTATFAIMAYEFPNNVMAVVGSLETFSGLGMMIGPPIGGVLYELGGFGLPFFILGVVVIICGVGSMAFMTSIPEGKTIYKGSILQLLRSVLVIVLFVNIVAACIALGFMDPTLSNHLIAEFNLKTWLIGIMFLIAPGIYGITAPIWGYIGDKKGHIRLMVTCGSFGALIAMLLLGPSPLLKFIPNELYINVIALALIGVTVGCSLIPTYKGLLLGANSLGMPNDLNTYGKVSGFFNSSLSLGAFLGPTIGGALVDEYGFPWACTWVSGVFLLAAILMLVHMICVPKLPKLEDSTSRKDIEASITRKNDAYEGDSANNHSDLLGSANSLHTK